jgi:hypothetical protein
MVGGQKVTQESFSPTLKATVLAAAQPGVSLSELHDKYTHDYASTGLRVSFGGGVDYALNRTVGFRVGGLEYSRAWLAPVNGNNYPDNLRLSMGLILRMD